MFVTAWFGVLDLLTGKVEFVNAGHNPPLVRHKDSTFDYLKSKPSFVIAGMEGMKYRRNEFFLSSGDEIYLYTDGVTEATDSENRLYGEERLVRFLNTLHGLSGEEICHAVKADVADFVDDAPQFDDITMLYLKYNGGGEK
jgi:sigma-B regulation protein RsbU (phosphoserine phosphatase)